MNNLNWDGFRFFIAAAEAGSLSAAALALGSNQSTVSRHIDVLETSMTVKLFRRSSKGLRLTEQGQAVYEQAQKIQLAVKKACGSVQGAGLDDNSAASGTVRLSLPEGLGQEVLIPLLDQFYRSYPGVKLVFNMSATTANLSQGEADVAVRLFRPEETGLFIAHLGEMRLGLYASKEYQSAYGLPAQLKDVRRHKVITYGELLSILPENQWLLNHSNQELRVLRSDSTVTRFKAAVSGVGLSLQPVALAKTAPNLVRLFRSVKLPAHNVWLVCDEDIQYRSGVRAVIDYLTECLGEALR